MDMYEFGRLCQPLNKEYYKLFGYIPHQLDYPCTREEFLEALSLSIKKNKEIFHFLDSTTKS